MNYNQQDIRCALSAAGINAGSVAIVHASLWGLGMPDDIDALHEMWLNALQEQVGPKGAIILPAFSYSYCRHEVFDPKRTWSTVNLLANHALSNHLGYRTLDPNFSYVILPGAQVEAQVAAYKFSNVSFDLTPSVYDLACSLDPDAHLVSIRTAQELDLFTCRHYVEQEVKRPMRFMKKFSGETEIDGHKEATDTFYNCRLLMPNTAFAMKPNPNLTVTLGQGGIYSVKVKDFIADFKAKITTDPWFELKGPALSPEEIAAQLAQETVCPPDEIVRTYHQGIKL